VTVGIDDPEVREDPVAGDQVVEDVFGHYFSWDASR
jgi:hypothetical protein